MYNHRIKNTRVFLHIPPPNFPTSLQKQLSWVILLLQRTVTRQLWETYWIGCLSIQSLGLEVSGELM